MSRSATFSPRVSLVVLAAAFCLPGANPPALLAAEKKVPVLLTRAIDSAWEGDLQSSRKYLRTFLSTKPAAELERKARLASLLLQLESPHANLDQAMKMCKALQGEPGISESFAFLYCRGLVYQRLGARSLAEEGGDQISLDQLIVQAATWRYFKGVAAPPANWKKTAFDAAGWLEGKMGIGYGDKDDATELTDMQGKYPSVFLRYDFDISPGVAARAESLRLRVRFDDGFIASLNGSELVRVNMPGRRGEEVAHDVTANGQHEGRTWEDYIVAAEGLVSGRNTLAIQAHNYTVPSSDFSIDATLSVAARREQPDARTVTLFAGAHQDLTAAAGLATTGTPQLQVATELVVLKLLKGRLEEAGWELLELERVAGEELKKRITYLRAWIAFREDRLLEAGRLLSRLAPFEGGRSSPGALYLMGRIHHGLGERREAEAFYRLVAGEGMATPLRVAGRQALGAVLIELGEYSAAEKILKEPASRKPPTAQKLLGRLLHGVALLGDGRLSSARNDFLSVSRAALDPELRSRALFWAGHCSVLSWEKGDAWLRKRLSVAAIDFLDRGLHLEPKPPLRRRLRVELGEALLKFDRFAEAEKVWGRLSGGGDEAAMEAAYARVVALQGQGEYSQSATLARQLVTLYPSSARRGVLLQRRGDALLFNGIARLDASARPGLFEGAVAAYEQALASPGLDARLTARLRLGTALLLLGKLQAAREVLEKVAKVAAQSSDDQVQARTAAAQGLLGQLYLLEGERQPGDALSAAQAAQNLEKAEKYLAEFRRDSNAPSELRTRAELALGRCQRLRAELLADPAEKKKLLDAARAVLSITTRRLEHSRSAVRATLELARTEVRAGRKPQAIQRLAVFKARSPWKESDAAGEALLELARLQKEARQYSEAQQTLKLARSLSLPGWLAGIHFEAARLLVKTGKAGEARDSFLRLYDGATSARIRGLTALELLRLEPGLHPGGLPEKFVSGVAALADTRRDELGAELRADLLLELARLGAAGARPGPRSDRTKKTLTTLRSMLPRDDRRVLASLLYESGLLVAAGRPEAALALTVDAYSFSRSREMEDEALLARGICLLAGEKVPGALKVLEELAAAPAPGDRSFNSRLALCLGVAYTRAGDPVKARESFSRAGDGALGANGAVALFDQAACKKMTARVRQLSLKPDDNAPETPVLLAEVLLFPLLRPVEKPLRWQVENRAGAARQDFLAMARLLELKPLPFEAEEKARPTGESWAELIPLPAAPAPGNTPGSFLGETVRRVLVEGEADE